MQLSLGWTNVYILFRGLDPDYPGLGGSEAGVDNLGADSIRYPTSEIEQDLLLLYIGGCIGVRFLFWTGLTIVLMWKWNGPSCLWKEQ